jgi:hypothetical protein
MRKYSLLFIPLLLWGCEDSFDNVIDVVQNDYQVTSVSGIKDTIDLKIPADSLMNVRLTFATGSKVNRAHFDIYASDNSKLNTTPVELLPLSDIIYQNQFILISENPIGNYKVNFFVTGFDGRTKQVAIKTFYFNNGQDNLPPVISNTVIDPDTVEVTQPTVIFTSVEATDPNGQNDIEQVYFLVYRPDGSTNGNKFQLLDNGDPANGDLVEGDGIYSLLIEVNENNQKGTYRFEFQAEDRSGELSNVLNHFVLIQ